MIKAIALDLDGTLLNKEKKISLENKNILKILSQKGYEILFVTGRPYSSTKSLAKELNIPITIICYNGAKIIDGSNDKIIFEKNLDEEKTKELISFSNSHNLNLNLYQNEKWLVSSLSSEGTKIYKKNSGLEPVLKDFNSLKDYNMTKAIFIDENKKLQNIKKLLKDKFQDSIYITFSQEKYLEILHKEINKGSTLKNVLIDKGINPINCIAFGDSENDFEMLTSVGIGVAMGNSHPSLKGVAHYIADTNENNGVAKFLRCFLQIS